MRGSRKSRAVFIIAIWPKSEYAGAHENADVMQDIKWIGCAPRNFRHGRPLPMDIAAVVIHVIDGSQVGADATFLNNTLAAPRSAHYSVGRDGSVHQYVQESDTAYHAGVIVQPTWTGMRKTASGGYVNPNSYTIGIEHEGHALDDWPDAMYASSAALLRAMSAKYPALKTLTRQNVVMHREICAAKSCPGSKADLDRLIQAAALIT
jgi:N-acetylmuramoyl-L-alanine amidase